MTNPTITYAAIRGIWYTEDGIIDDLAGDVCDVVVIGGRAHYGEPIGGRWEPIRIVVDSITGPYLAFPAATFSPDPGEIERTGIIA